MSEPRYVAPLLDGFSLGQAISDHSGVECYPAMRDDSEKRYIVKKISLPASQVQVEALLLTGVYRDAEAVGAYYRELAQGVCEEVRILEKLSGQRGFVPYQGCQVEQMEEGIGYEVHLLSRYRKTLDRFTRRNPMTHLGAVNLGIDLCAALAVSREAGWLYVDLKPENIYLFGDQEYRIGDLGFVAMDSLAYASLPDRYRSIYTAPEVADAYASLNATMDTYALGLVLYQIYNEGKLPFAPEERQVWLDQLADGGSVAPPSCADPEMAEIICKACAYAPEDRWQTPAQMGHALISYMQRNGADDIPIAPPPQPEPEEPETVEEEVTESVDSEEIVEKSSEESILSDIKVEESPGGTEASESIVEENSADSASDSEAVEEVPAESSETPDSVEEASESSGETAPDSPAAGEDAPEADWIDLMDAFLAEEEDGTEAAPSGDEPTLRELMSGTDEDMPDAPPLTEEEVSAETAHILTAANELIEHEAPAPVVAPEPIDLPIPEPIPVELPALQQPAAEEEKNAAEETPAQEPETPPAPPAPPVPEKKKGLWKKPLGAMTGLVLTVAIAFGIWYWYTNLYLQTIDSMTVDGSGTQVTVTVFTDMDQSKLTVVCKDTYGNATEGKLDNGIATFSDLVPGSQYLISLEPEGFHKLEGTTSVTWSTPRQTTIMHMAAVTGQESGSAIVSFGVEGVETENWTLTYTAEGLEPQSITFTGHSVTVTGLTVGTEYTFTLTTDDEVLLVGENIVTHTASDLVQAQDLAMSNYQDGVLTLTWSAPADVSVESWIVRCWNESGYDQFLEVTEPRAAFDGITEGESYTVEVTAADMTLGVRSEITAQASAISDFAAVQKGSSIELTWNNPTGIPCTVECIADGRVLRVITPEENTASFGPVAPGTVYTFTIKPGNTSADVPASTATVETPAVGTFSANKLDSYSIIVTMHNVPSKSSWNYSTLKRAKEKDTFKPGSSLALLYTVTRPYSFDSGEFETVFVIRDREGKLVSTSARIRKWDDMWDNGYCTEQVSGLPADQGDYSLSIYIANGLLVELPFTIQ